MNACYVFGTFIYMLFHLILSKTIVKTVLLNVALPSSSVLCSAPLSFCCTTLAFGLCFKHSNLTSTSGPLYLLFPLPGLLSSSFRSVLIHIRFLRETHIVTPHSNWRYPFILFCVFLLSMTVMAVSIETQCVFRVLRQICNLEQCLEYSKRSITVCWKKWWMNKRENGDYFCHFTNERTEAREVKSYGLCSSSQWVPEPKSEASLFNFRTANLSPHLSYSGQCRRQQSRGVHPSLRGGKPRSSRETSFKN